jgi:hypothetical protein
MAEETERQVKEENHDFEEEQGEISDEVFVSGIKEPQKQVPVVEDQQVNVLPDNEEEEKEEILLTTASVASPHKAKSALRKRQLKEINSADIGKHLKRQTEQLTKVTTMQHEGLKNNTDGSLDIYIQHASPGKDRESNWLPSDKNSFNLILRMYLPAEEVSVAFIVLLYYTSYLHVMIVLYAIYT